jgi:hypothetical protein
MFRQPYKLDGVAVVEESYFATKKRLSANQGCGNDAYVTFR